MKTKSSNTKVVKKFDLLISPINQDEWINDQTPDLLNLQILDRPEQKIRYENNYKKLSELEQFKIEIQPFLRQYFRRCVIKPAITEMEYWCTTALPSTSSSDFKVLIRLNLYWCEVLTIGIRTGSKDVHFSFHLSKDGFTSKVSIQLKKEIQTLDGDDHYYVKGGDDQMHIWVENTNDAMKLIQDDTIIEAIKSFNLRQMQKGATVYSKYHCVELGRAILLNEI